MKRVTYLRSVSYVSLALALAVGAGCGNRYVPPPVTPLQNWNSPLAGAGAWNQGWNQWGVNNAWPGFNGMWGPYNYTWNTTWPLAGAWNTGWNNWGWNQFNTFNTWQQPWAYWYTIWSPVGTWGVNTWWPLASVTSAWVRTSATHDDKASSDNRKLSDRKLAEAARPVASSVRELVAGVPTGLNSWGTFAYVRTGKSEQIVIDPRTDAEAEVLRQTFADYRGGRLTLDRARLGSDGQVYGLVIRREGSNRPLAALTHNTTECTSVQLPARQAENSKVLFQLRLPQGIALESVSADTAIKARSGDAEHDPCLDSAPLADVAAQ